MSADLLPQVRLGTGAPLVVLPGMSARLGSPGRLGRWILRKQLADLAVNREVWRIDRRPGLAVGASIEDLAGDYARTLRALFAEPVDVVGVSTGGSIALQLAADHAQLVRRLVLVSSAHRLSDHGRHVQRTTASLLRANRPRRAAAGFLANNGTNPLARAFLASAGFLAPRLVLGRAHGDLLITLDAEDAFDLEYRLESIPVPTLVAGGAQDRFYSAALFEHTSGAMPNASLSLYRRAGHMSTQGNPRLVSEILRFLAVH